MDNIIYSYGGGEALFKVLSGIARIYNSDISKDFIYMMTFVGMTWAAFQGAIQNIFTPKLSWVAKYALITSLFITPTASLVVTDVVYKTRKKIDDLPIGLVLPASVFSGIGYSITESFDQAFSDIGDHLAYTKYGQNFGASLISQARNFKIQDAVFRENIEGFIDNCIIYDVMVGSKYSASDLRDSTNIWGLVSKNASSIRMFNYRGKNKEDGRKLVTCRDGVKLLEDYWKTDIDKLADRYGSSIFGRYGAKATQSMENSHTQTLSKAFESNIAAVTQLYSKNSNATFTLKQIMMINAMADIPMSYGAVKAKQQQQESWLISGQLAREILPTLHAVFAALIYASFILIIGMLVLPNGFRTLGNYFGLLIWIETWPPLFAVLNLLTNVSAKTFGGDFSTITMNNASQIISHNNNISVVASGMMMVLPYLSYNLLKGGAGQFVHLANQVMGSSQGAVMAASSEVTSGNRSLDNVSMSNGQWHNNSGFKTDMNTSFRSGHQEHQLSDGMLVKRTASGVEILHSGPGITESVGADSMHMSKSNSTQDHQSLSKEIADLKTKEVNYSKLEQKGIKESAEYVQRMAAGELSGVNYNYDKTTASGKVLHDAIEEQKQIQMHHGYSHNQSTSKGFGVKLGAEASMGSGGNSEESVPSGLLSKIPGGKVSASLGGDLSYNGSLNHINDQSLSENKGSGTNMNVSEQAEHIARAAKSMSYGETQHEEKSLGDSLIGTYDEMTELRRSISARHEEIDRHQSSQENIRGTSYTENRDTYPERLDYFANKRDQDGFKIGKVSAARIIRDKGPQYEALDQEYISKHLPTQRMLNYNSNFDKLVKDNIPDVDLKEGYNNVKSKGKEVMGDDAKINKQAEIEYQQESMNNVANIGIAEDRILESGNVRQDEVNRSEGKKGFMSEKFGVNKDMNEKFKD
ncbi:MAG: conjugal transfer protein TraG N-terminal domain-containing protein [Rickettsiales bacterium]|jgi:conjugal transfer mating pair stabilization protein TraG|nr:conjugal transfer protein TraG N-terminal domain-containing protein [Rickettsiales bacterium]